MRRTAHRCVPFFFFSVGVELTMTTTISVNFNPIRALSNELSSSVSQLPSMLRSSRNVVQSHRSIGVIHCVIGAPAPSRCGGRTRKRGSSAPTRVGGTISSSHTPSPAPAPSTPTTSPGWRYGVVELVALVALALAAAADGVERGGSVGGPSALHFRTGVLAATSAIANLAATHGARCSLFEPGPAWRPFSRNNIGDHSLLCVVAEDLDTLRERRKRTDLRLLKRGAASAPKLAERQSILLAFLVEIILQQFLLATRNSAGDNGPSRLAKGGDRLRE
jgi:hypothetical protein